MATNTHKDRKGSDLETQAIALAEKLGRIAGTLEGTAGSWLKRDALAAQLTRVRDEAAQMLAGLTRGPAGRTGKRRAPAKPAARARKPADPAHAPGKRRRKPAPTMHGVKKSDTAIPKLRSAKAARQRRKSYA